MTIRLDNKKAFLFTVLPYIFWVAGMVFFILDLYDDGFWANISIFFYTVTIILLIYILYKSILNIRSGKGMLIINEEGILDRSSIYALEILLPWAYVDRIISKRVLGRKYIAVYLNEPGRRAYIRQVEANMSPRKRFMISANGLVSPVAIRTASLEKSHEEIYEFMIKKLNEHRGESVEKIS